MPFICFQSFISMKIRKYFCSNHIFLYFCNGKVSRNYSAPLWA